MVIVGSIIIINYNRGTCSARVFVVIVGGSSKQKQDLEWHYFVAIFGF